MTPYLAPSEYSAYGLEGVTDSQVRRASLQIDSYLGATKGLLWVPDAQGRPCYMANALPLTSTTLQSSLAVGDEYAVTAPTLIGRNTATPEMLSGGLIEYPHGPGELVETGMAETLTLRVDRGVARFRPVARILSVSGYSHDGPGLFERGFYGGRSPSGWYSVPLETLALEPGSLTLDSYYTRVRIEAITGWRVLPEAIKQAVALAALDIYSAFIDGTAGYKRLKAGDSEIERFGPGGFVLCSGSEAASLLAPYRQYRI